MGFNATSLGIFAPALKSGQRDHAMCNAGDALVIENDLVRVT